VGTTCREDYVTGKAKEKGIDLSTIHRGTGAGGGATGAKYKFNAFSLKNGGVASAGSSRDNKRKREDGDDEDREGKKEKKVSSAYFQGLSVEIVLIVVYPAPQPVFLYIEYLGKKLAVDRAAGTLADADELDYPRQTVLKFSNLPEDGDWKELKTSLIDGGFPETFMSYPKGAAAGSLCLKSNEPISDETLEKIQGLKLELGGNTVDWRRATGECVPV
jgi:hypothetical protein